MAYGDAALLLKNAITIAKTGNVVRWSKYEVLVGEHKQFGSSSVWTVVFLGPKT